MAWELAVVHRSVFPAIARVNVAAAVYLSFCIHADEDGSNGYPSLHKMAATLGVNHRSVQRAVRSLEAAGLLIFERRRDQLIRSYRVVKLAAGLPLDSIPTSGAYAVRQQETSGKSAAITSGKNGAQLAADSPHNQIPRPDPINHIRSGEAPHVASRCDSGGQEAPFGRMEDEAQEGAGAPAVEGEVPWGSRSAYAEVDARAAAEEALIAQHRAKQEQSFLETCIRSEAEALLQAGLYSTLPPAARLPALISLTRDYRTRWPRSWPSAWLDHAASLNGAIKDKPAFVATHLEGYARKDWIPENKTEPERFDHLRILKGELE